MAGTLRLTLCVIYYLMHNVKRLTRDVIRRQKKRKPLRGLTLGAVYLSVILGNRVPAHANRRGHHRATK